MQQLEMTCHLDDAMTVKKRLSSRAEGTEAWGSVTNQEKALQQISKRHCEERSDAAIQTKPLSCFAIGHINSLKSGLPRRPKGLLVMTQVIEEMP